MCHDDHEHATKKNSKSQKLSFRTLETENPEQLCSTCLNQKPALFNHLFPNSSVHFLRGWIFIEKRKVTQKKRERKSEWEREERWRS